MELNDLLRKQDVNPEQVIVFRHRPFEPKLNRVFPWLAADRPELFNAYQQTHGERVERALQAVTHVASFIGQRAGEAVFVGLYSVGAAKSISMREYWEIPAHSELKALGMKGFTEEENRSSILLFELTLLSFYAQWKGRLVVAWPTPERSWWRRAHRNEMQVKAILEESAFDARMPEWYELSLSWEQLKVLPNRWATALRHWRAVYYIFDISDCKGYVGSAYGADNLGLRWENYGISGHGGNILLKKRDPRNFLFSILERVSPDMEGDGVIRLEAAWKDRLHTRSPYGLNEN
jgi:hypothetical protein